MLVFLDFEASSLRRNSYPIEIGWIFEDGASESHLIRPAPGWDDWEPAAEAIHHIPRATLLSDGVPHEAVAARMVETLAGHDLTASAPSWDGKWLSVLLRAAGLPRHTLRLRDTEEVWREAAEAALAEHIPAAELDAHVTALIERLSAGWASLPPRHRALADAEEERRRWLEVRDAAQKLAGEKAA
jgi:hypothetical protein